MMDIQYYPNSECFYDQTINGKIVAIGKPFTVAGAFSLKVSMILDKKNHI